MWRKRTSEKPKRLRVGLALSGGAARGIAHVGVLKVLEEHNIRVDCIAGTSAGAVVAGAYAAGLSLADLEDVGRKMRWRNMGRVTLSKLGIQHNERMGEFIRERFPVTRFEDLKMPLAVVAADLRTGETVVLKDEGDLAFAIRASCALPGWYVPVTDEGGRQLVDGGLVANVPTAAVRSLGADVVIAVDVNAEGAKFMGAPQSLIGVLMQSMIVVHRTAAARQLELADVVIRPKIGHIRWDDMGRADELIAAGEHAARACLEEIRFALEPPAEPPRKWLRRWQSEAANKSEKHLTSS